MFNSLQDKLDKALHNLSGRGKITEINVAETVKEIRRALVDADVNYKVAKDLTKRVQDKAIGENQHQGRTVHRVRLQPARHTWVHQGTDRRSEQPRVRHDDRRRRAAPQARTLSDFRLRQQVRQDRPTLSLRGIAHPHDGGIAAVHLRGD